MSLDDMGRIFGEIIALRLVTQRLLAQLASKTGDFEGTLTKELEAVMEDLKRMDINDADPKRAERIRMHAESVLDQMHTNMRKGRPPS